MKTIPILRGGLLSVAAAVVSMSLAGPARTLSLEEGFRSPPDSAKPQVYYFMMNGNITKEGLTCDFEAMAKAGLGGMIMMDAGCYMPAGPCTFNSSAWFDMLRHALATLHYAREITRLAVARDALERVAYSGLPLRHARQGRDVPVELMRDCVLAAVLHGVRPVAVRRV